MVSSMASVHPARPWRARRRCLAALAAAGVLALGACSDSDAASDPAPTAATPAGDTTDSPLPPASEGFPEREGDPVELASGGEGEMAWSVTVQGSVAGLCILIEGAAEGQMAEGCGFEVPERNAVSSFRFPRDDAAGYAVVAGQAAPDATAVRLELVDGGVLEPELQDDPTGAGEAQVYVAEVVPAQAVVAVEALAGREVLQRREPAGENPG